MKVMGLPVQFSTREEQEPRLEVRVRTDCDAVGKPKFP